MLQQRHPIRLAGIGTSGAIALEGMNRFKQQSLALLELGDQFLNLPADER